jgi:uncharacterized protein
MTSGITREKALELLRTYVKKENMISHSLASEAVLRGLARRLGRNEDLWGIAGLLHDIDVEITEADPKTHGRVAIGILQEHGVSPEIIDAISMHNEEAAELPRSTEFHYALAAGETITGLVVATTLVYPDKKLASVKPKSVVKRMKEKAFAASVRRESILECEKIGLTIDEFATIAISSMLEIHEQIGL